MVRHSKGNRTRPFFTYEEKRDLGYGTKKMRVIGGGVKDVDACGLCLLPARTPLVCPDGHLYCKECIYDCLLQQKQETKRQNIIVERQEARLKAEEEAMEVATDKTKKDRFHARETTIMVHDVPDTLLTREEREKRRSLKRALEKDIEDKTIHNDWIVEHTPQAKETVLKKKKDVTMCPEGSHPLKLKHLTPVSFTAAPGMDDIDPNAVHTGRFMCASCSKQLSNGPKAVVLKRCGDVICGECHTRFVMKDMICPKCEIRAGSEDIIHLQAGGTSFAAHNRVESESKVTPAFVC